MSRAKPRNNKLFPITIAVGFFVILGVLAGFIQLLKLKSSPEVAAAQTINAIPFPGTVEREPNNTWDQAKANGYISLTNNTTYTGNFDGNTSTEGSDKFYIWFNALTTRRTFSLNSSNLSGVQLTLYHFPPVGSPVAVAADQTAPFSITYTFGVGGDYELIVHADPTLNNRSAYSVSITNPDVAVKCPWSGPIAISVLPGSGSMQMSSSYVIGSNLFQIFARGGQHFARTVPIINNVADFTKATPWVGPSTNSDYNLPGSGTLQTDSEYVLNNKVWQGIWRGDQGWTRQIPIIDNQPIWSCAKN